MATTSPLLAGDEISRREHWRCGCRVRPPSSRCATPKTTCASRTPSPRSPRSAPTSPPGCCRTPRCGPSPASPTRPPRTSSWRSRSNGTTTHLERAIAGYRRTGQLDDQAANDRHHQGRYLRWWLDDGMVVFEGRLTPEDAAIVTAATTAPTKRSPERPTDTDQVPQPGHDTEHARQADALVALLTGDTTPGAATTVIVHVDTDTLAHWCTKAATPSNSTTTRSSSTAPDEPHWSTPHPEPPPGAGITHTNLNHGLEPTTITTNEPTTITTNWDGTHLTHNDLSWALAFLNAGLAMRPLKGAGGGPTLGVASASAAGETRAANGLSPPPTTRTSARPHPPQAPTIDPDTHARRPARAPPMTTTGDPTGPTGVAPRCSPRLTPSLAWCRSAAPGVDPPLGSRDPDRTAARGEAGCVLGRQDARRHLPPGFTRVTRPRRPGGGAPPSARRG